VLRARAVVDARGPWTGAWNGHEGGRAGERPRPRAAVRLARGSHVVLPAAALPLAHTVVFFAAGDRRPLFASPRGRHVVIGTTDVPHSGTPDQVVPTRGEIDYLMESLARAFPGACVRRDASVTAFAGVRALAVNGGGAGGADGGTAVLDRDYAVGWQEPGLLFIRGGKLTLGLDGARRALRALRAQSRALGLPDIIVPAVGTLPAPLAPSRPLVTASDDGRARADVSPTAVSAAAVPSSSTGRAA
jgi:glycerol-3-phosphate dehydrogenase